MRAAFQRLCNSELAILQGLEKLKRLANASLLGTVMGLVLSIPLFYWLRIDSILISLIVYHASLLVAALIYRHKGSAKVTVSNKEALREGSAFVKLGLLMTLSEFITMLFNYIFSAYLNRVAGTEIVGFYQAGYSLVGRYFGLIFTAIGMEYYPRITRVCHSRLRTRVFASQEVNIMMLCLLPIISIFLIARELIVSILYSGEFRAIIPYISFAIVGTVMRAYSWFLAIVIVARGDGKIYIVTETLSVLTGFALNVACYHLWGLAGLGVAFCLWYAAYCLIVGVVYFRRYGTRCRASLRCYRSSPWLSARQSYSSLTKDGCGQQSPPQHHILVCRHPSAPACQPSLVLREREVLVARPHDVFLRILVINENMERQVVFSFRHVQLIVRHKQAEVAEARAVVVRRERIRTANLTARCAVIVVVVLQKVASLIFEISDAFSFTSLHSVNRKLHVDEHSLLAVLPLVVVDPHILHIA